MSDSAFRTVMDMTLARHGPWAAPNGLVANRLLTANEVAAWAQIPRSSVYEYARRAHDPLPHLKIGRHLRFRRVEIEEWLERQR